MLLGIISDTHGHSGYTLDAVRMLESLEVDQVLHCGDIGSPAIPGLLSRWTCHFVLGNIDRDEAELREAVQAASHQFHGRLGRLELAGRRIALLHGDDSRQLKAEIESQQWDVVCFGHTHKAEQYRHGKTLVLNPGALYRARPHTLALLELPQLQATHVSVS